MDTGHKTTGRKKHSDRPVSFEVSIPTTLRDKLDLHLLDAVTLKPIYGARSKLVQLLLRDYFNKIAKSGAGNLNETLTTNLISKGLENLTDAELAHTIEDCLAVGGFPTAARLLIDEVARRIP